MVKILMMSAEMTTIGVLIIKVFREKGYDGIVSVHDVTCLVIAIIM